MTVLGFNKPTEEEPDLLELAYEDEVQTRQWSIDQAIVICGFDRSDRSDRPTDVVEEAQKLYDYVVGKAAK